MSMSSENTYESRIRRAVEDLGFSVVQLQADSDAVLLSVELVAGDSASRKATYGSVNATSPLPQVVDGVLKWVEGLKR